MESFSRTGIVKVPLNTSKFLNFDNISLRSPTTVLESVRKPSEVAIHQPGVHSSGKTVKKVKGISWKPTDAEFNEKSGDEQTTAKSVTGTGTKCLTKSKEVPESSPIFDELDWTKYLSSRAKSKLNELNSNSNTSAISKDVPSAPAALTKSKVSEDEFQSDEISDQQQILDTNEDKHPEPKLPPDLPPGLKLHPTNPFFADGEGAFSLPLPLYREKLMEPDETMENSYFSFQDGGECVNPFLDRTPSPVTESVNALFDVLQQNDVTSEATTPEPAPDPVAAWNWAPLSPPSAPSIYFLTPRPHTLGLEASKAYRNRRTESNPITLHPTCTPKFLTEVRASLSDISLVPAVSSAPSIPSSATESRESRDESSARTRSSSDDQNADTEEVDGYVVPRHKNKKKFRKYKRNGAITATNLDSKIIEILTSYNRVTNPGAAEQRNFLQSRNRPASCSVDRTQSVPTQKLDFRFPQRVPKNRASQHIEVKRKCSVNPESSCRPLVIPRGLPNVPKPKMPLQRNIIQENIILAKYGCGTPWNWSGRMGLDADKLAQNCGNMLNRTKSNLDQSASAFVQKKASMSKMTVSGIKRRDSNSRLSKNK